MANLPTAGPTRTKNSSIGSGAVVMPDADKEIQAFAKSLGRPVKHSDRPGWEAYAERLSIPQGDVAPAWASLRVRMGVTEAMDVLDSVFEGVSASGSWMPNPLLTKMRHGAPGDEPNPEPTKPGPNAVIAAAPPSFPFHTKVSRKVYEKALKLKVMYPLEGPSSILKRAIMAVGATPLVDITPEDEMLLRMAIDFAQNGPAKSKGNKIGGLPGGPFNSTGDDYSVKRGAP